MSTPDTMREKADIYRNKFSRDPGKNPIPGHRVRAYTPVERRAVEEGNRHEQIIARIAIDRVRYTEAADQHPSMSEHFNGLIQTGITALAGWQQYFEEQAASRNAEGVHNG